MATVVNTTQPADSNGGMGTGIIIGIILLAVMMFLFFYFGLPYLRGGATQGNGGTQINVPDKVDVNVKGSYK